MIDELFAYSKCLWWGELSPNYLGHYIIHVTNDIYSAGTWVINLLSLGISSLQSVILAGCKWEVRFFFSVGKLYVTCSLKHCQSIDLLIIELPC